MPPTPIPAPPTSQNIDPVPKGQTGLLVLDGPHRWWFPCGTAEEAEAKLKDFRGKQQTVFHDLQAVFVTARIN